MPGFMSDLFQPDEGAQSAEQTTAVAGDGETGFEASPSVSMVLGGSYEGADGSANQWSNETELGTDIDPNVAIVTTNLLATDPTSDAG